MATSRVLNEVLFGVDDASDVEFTGNLLISGVGNTTLMSVEQNATSSGTSQTDAYVLSAACTEFGTVASGSGCVFRPVSAMGKTYEIYNRGSYTLSIYPASGQKFAQSAANAAYMINSGQAAIVRGLRNTEYAARRVSILT